MARQLGAAHSFTRGWETMSHGLQMFHISALWLMVVSLVSGVALGGGWFVLSLAPEARGALRDYVTVSASVAAVEWRDAHLPPRTRSPKRKSKGPEALRQHYQEAVFGDRALGYLILQCGCRVGLVGGLTLLLGSLLAFRHGRSVMGDRYVRGVSLVDRRGKRLRWAGILVPAALAGLCSAIFSVTVWPAGLCEYGWAALLKGWPELAKAFTPSHANAGTAWFAGPLPEGFYAVEEVYQGFRERVFGVPFGVVVAGWLAGTVVLWLAILALRRVYRGRRDSSKANLHLAQVSIPTNDECAHFLFTGAPGSGKSTAIKSLLTQIRARQQRAVVYDISGEYIERFYRPGKDKILNPLDARSEVWQLWADANDAISYTEMARSLFVGTGKDAFWADSATTVFAAAAAVLARQGSPTNAKFHRTLTCATLPELVELLAGTPAERLLSGEAGPMPLSVMATVTSKLDAFGWLPDPKPGKPAFSIREFVQKESDSWLFLAVREDKRKATRPLVSLWYDLAASAILALPEDERRRIWCVLDEVASLQQLPALEELMTRGRKKGAPVILGLQSISQLRESYGRDGAAALAAMPQTWLVLRTAEPETAQWLEQALGTAEVEESRTSLSMGTQAARDGVSIQRDVRQRPIVLASEIASLPTMEGYLKQPGRRDVWRVAYHYEPATQRQPAFVPRSVAKAG